MYKRSHVTTLGTSKEFQNIGSLIISISISISIDQSIFSELHISCIHFKPEKHQLFLVVHLAAERTVINRLATYEIQTPIQASGVC